VHVTVPSGEHPLFTFYADEYTFDARDFVGLTVTQAQQLHVDRDVAYLQSP